MDAELSGDSRQRVADVVAMMVLTQFNMEGADADLFRLGSMVAAYCAGENPETLQKYGEMDWPKAVRAIKIAFARHYLVSQGASPDELPPPAVDEKIGKCLIAAFFKFVTFRSINPEWCVPHLAQMPFVAELVPSA